LGITLKLQQQSGEALISLERHFIARSFSIGEMPLMSY
jgi:hypothetical protein